MTTHLRLVHPSKPTTRKPPPTFTNEHREKLAIALRNLHGRYGRWQAVADEMGVTKAALMLVFRGKGGSMAMAYAAAALAKVPVERLLSGSIVPVNTCPTCGHQAGGPTK